MVHSNIEADNSTVDLGGGLLTIVASLLKKANLFLQVETIEIESWPVSRRSLRDRSVTNPAVEMAMFLRM